MLNWRPIALALVAVTSVFLWWWGSLGFPPEGQVCPWPKNSYQPPCTTHYFIIASIRSAFLWVEEFHASLLVFGTFLLAGIVAVQVREAVKSSERQLRAYITVKIIGCDEPENRKGIFNFHLKIMNTGQTPAHEVRIIARTDIFDYPFSKDFDFTIPQLENPSVSVLGSRQTISCESQSDPMTPITWPQITSKSSGRRLCTYGTITYRDVFGDPQHTNFCTAHLVEILDLKAGRYRITGQIAEPHNDAS